MKSKTDVGSRLASMIIDHFIMSFACTTIAMPAMMMDMMNNWKNPSLIIPYSPNTIAIFFFSIGFAL